MIGKISAGITATGKSTEKDRSSQVGTIRWPNL